MKRFFFFERTFSPKSCPLSQYLNAIGLIDMLVPKRGYDAVE